jgi:voltage-gated potassium channel
MRRHPFALFTRPLLVLVAVITYGTVGFMLIEGWNFLDSLFMTVISITTVGYEEVHPLGAHGQAFAISLIVFGVAGFLYTFGVLVDILGSGRWQEYRRFRRMQDQLSRLRDHVIVCGYGRTGKQVVAELEQGGHAYVVVEMNPHPFEEVLRDRRLHVHGDAASDEVLHMAGIERARALVSAVDSDERNVYIVLTARSINPRLFIVARSSYPDSQSKLARAGADRVVSPYTLSGRRMAALALQPAVMDTIDLVLGGGPEGGRMAIEELVVPPGSATLDAASLRRSGAVVLAVRSPRGALSVAPDDGHPIQAEDLIVAMGTRAQLDDLAEALRPVASNS